MINSATSQTLTTWTCLPLSHSSICVGLRDLDRVEMASARRFKLSKGLASRGVVEYSVFRTKCCFSTHSATTHSPARHQAEGSHLPRQHQTQSMSATPNRPPSAVHCPPNPNLFRSRCATRRMSWLFITADSFFSSDTGHKRAFAHILSQRVIGGAGCESFGCYFWAGSC